MITKTYNLSEQQQAEYEDQVRRRCRRIKSIRELEFEAMEEQRHIDALYLEHLRDEAAKQGEEYYYAQHD